MQRITLFCIGSLKESWAKEAARLYRERLASMVDLRVVELQPSRHPHPEKQREEESERLLLSARKQSGALWVLDETGSALTSQEFAREISVLRDRGEVITVLLGGSYGLSDSVRTAARRVISLSAMTLPHELCRIVFLEQLYRAHEIMKGSGYHH